MGFAAWPAYADDIGDKISGTIINAALFNAIKADIEADVFSAVNPLVTPEQIIDEVVNARGTAVDLDTRLSVCLNADGTLKPITGLATETQVISQLGQMNLVKNGNLDIYQYLAADALPGGKPGVTNPPEGWTFAGGGTLARCGPGEADGTSLGTGQWTQKITAAGVNATMSQAVITTAEGTDHHLQLEGRKVQFYVVYKAAGANSIQIEVADGGATTTSAWLPAAGTPTLAALEHTVNGAWTSLTVTIRIAAGAAVYVGGAGLIVSDLTPTVWPYEPGIWYRSGVQRLAGFSALLHSCGAGAYQDVLTLLGGIPAGALGVNQAIRIFLSGTMANNANAKAIRIYLGTNFVTPLSSAVASGVANTVWTLDAWIMPTSLTAAVMTGLLTFNAATTTAPTIWHFGASFAGGATNLAANTPLIVSLSGVAGNDIVLSHGFIELVKF